MVLTIWVKLRRKVIKIRNTLGVLPQQECFQELIVDPGDKEGYLCCRFQISKGWLCGERNYTFE